MIIKENTQPALPGAIGSTREDFEKAKSELLDLAYWYGEPAGTGDAAMMNAARKFVAAERELIYSSNDQVQRPERENL